MRTVLFIIVGCMVAGAQAASVLFEDFEPSNGVATGSLDGQNGWSVDSGSGNVQSSVVQSGNQALEISAGGVSKGISTNESVLWLHFYARITEAPQLDPVLDPASALVAFYVNTNLNLVVLSNGVPVELAAQIPVNVWTRFDIYCNSVSGVWNLAMDGSNVASGLPMVSSNAFDQVMVSNESAASSFLDSLDIADTEQVGKMPDSDADGIPDWWEQENFGGVTNCTAGAPSGNGGLTYKETYVAVLDPFSYDPPFMALDNPGAVQWTSKASRLHDVEWAPCLQSNFVAIASDIPWPVDSYFDAAHTNDPSGFYRVKIHL